MTAEPSFFSSRKTFRQLFSYALIGVTTNVLGYALYLRLTYLWGAPKLSMTALYFIGVLIGFFANRRFTFLNDGGIGITSFRYLLAQAAGYLLNLVLLLLFVDWLDFPHKIVQAIVTDVQFQNRSLGIVVASVEIEKIDVRQMNINVCYNHSRADKCLFLTCA